MIYLAFEDKKKTALMRKFDLFEDFKFIGMFLHVSKKTDDFIPEWIETDDYMLVAQVTKNGYEIKSGYEETFMSDGVHFGSLNALCNIKLKTGYFGRNFKKIKVK